MRVRQKILFTAVVLGAALMAIELGTRLMVPGSVATKAWIMTSVGAGHCYSAPPPGGGLPLDLNTPAHRARLRAILKEASSGIGGKELNVSMEHLVRTTPHCIIYDSAARLRGFFPGRQRQVALVGDSFAFGEGLRDKETLGYLLGQAYPSTNFRTLASPGAEIEDCRAMLVRAIHDLNIRRVGYFFNLNDIIAEGPLEQETSPGLDYGRTESEWVLRLSSLSRLVKLLDATRVAAVRTDKIVDGYRRRFHEPQNSKNVERTLDILEQMNGIAHEQGAALVVVLYPLLYQSLLGSYPLADIHQDLMGQCKKRNIHSVDGQQAFEDVLLMTRYHVHRADSHPNVRAHEAMVRYLVERKVLERRLPDRPRPGAAPRR